MVFHPFILDTFPRGVLFRPFLRRLRQLKDDSNPIVGFSEFRLYPIVPRRAGFSLALPDALFSKTLDCTSEFRDVAKDLIYR